MKISVVMASYLHPYPNSAKNRPAKFVRAVKSFLNQTHVDKELIIVSDGCDITVKLYEQNFKDKENIKLISLPKQPFYGGETRNAGLKIATGDIISYLDSDDVLGKDHLKIIAEQFTDEVDLVYYDDYLVMNKELNKFQLRKVLPRWASIGTSSISHRNDINKFSWEKMDGYSHDFLFVFKSIVNGASFKKLEKCSQYLVCHFSAENDW